MSETETKQKSMLLSVLLPVVIGCFLTCFLNIIINHFQYGGKVVKLEKKLDSYENDILTDEVTNVNMMQLVKWEIIPTIFNLIVWGVIIWYIIKKNTATTTPIDTM
jgi:hypothetical protein